MSISDSVNKFWNGSSSQKPLSTMDKKLILAHENAKALNYLLDWHDNWTESEIDFETFWAIEIPEYIMEYNKKMGVLGTRLTHKMDAEITTENLNDWILCQKAGLAMQYESNCLRGFVINAEAIAGYPSLKRMLDLYKLNPETAISEAHNTIDSLLEKYLY